LCTVLQHNSRRNEGNHQIYMRFHRTQLPYSMHQRQPLSISWSFWSLTMVPLLIAIDKKHALLVRFIYASAYRTFLYEWDYDTFFREQHDCMESIGKYIILTNMFILKAQFTLCETSLGFFFNYHFLLALSIFLFLLTLLLLLCFWLCG